CRRANTCFLSLQVCVELHNRHSFPTRRSSDLLHANSDGTYGICKECGRDISFERLEALPTADTCIEHAERNSDIDDRPIEEAVFSPQIKPDPSSQYDQTAYDEEDTWQDVSRYGTS